MCNFCIDLVVDIFHDRLQECPPDLIEGISSIIWATNRVEIEELQEVRNQFKLKYGSDFIKNADENAGGVVNARLLQKLSVQPPSAFLVG
jgi:vacuolar protein sorting-associated protein IST1